MRLTCEKGISEGPHDADMYSAINPIMSGLRNEISRHQSYWQTHAGEVGKKREGINKIYLCGGGSNIPGFVEYLSLELSTPVALANTMVNVNTLNEYVPEVSFGESLHYATAIGLALRKLK